MPASGEVCERIVINWHGGDTFEPEQIMNDLRVETPQVSHFLSQSSWSGCESAQACKMRRFISPDKDKVDRSESCHLAKFGKMGWGMGPPDPLANMSPLP